MVVMFSMLWLFSRIVFEVILFGGMLIRFIIVEVDIDLFELDLLRIVNVLFWFRC